MTDAYSLNLTAEEMHAVNSSSRRNNGGGSSKKAMLTSVVENGTLLTDASTLNGSTQESMSRFTPKMAIQPPMNSQYIGPNLARLGGAGTAPDDRNDSSASKSAYSNSEGVRDNNLEGATNPNGFAAPTGGDAASKSSYPFAYDSNWRATYQDEASDSNINQTNSVTFAYDENENIHPHANNWRSAVPNQGQGALPLSQGNNWGPTTPSLPTSTAGGNHTTGIRNNTVVNMNAMGGARQGIMKPFNQNYQAGDPQMSSPNYQGGNPPSQSSPTPNSPIMSTNAPNYQQPPPPRAAADVAHPTNWGSKNP